MFRNNIWIFLFLSVSVTTICGQSSKNITLEYDGQKISYNAFNSFKAIMESNLTAVTFTNSSLIVIQPSLKHTGLKMIEGMDSKKVGKSSLHLKIKNLVTLRDTLMKLSVDVAGNNENELDNEVLNRMTKDKKFIGDLTLVLSNFTNEVTSKLALHISKIKELETTKDIHQALQATYKLESMVGSSNADISALKKELKTKYDTQACEKTLYDAKILINSGVEYQMNRAVNLLLQIPPIANCRVEALKLSDELFLKMMASSPNKEKLNRYKKLMAQNDENQWVELMSEK